MEERKIKAQLRRQMGKTGWTVLIYYFLVNSAVAVTGILQAVVTMLASNSQQFPFEEALSRAIMENGWGYLVAILIGAFLMLVWKKKDFCFHTIWISGRKMTIESFFMLLSVFLAGQPIFSLLYAGVEWLLNLLGFSAANAAEAAAFTTDSLSMFLYLGLFAPIAEEILFRGLLLRMLLPYGKRLAILATAFLFGMFHGNIVQSPFTFGIGLVLGYVAVEYSIGWAMVLHMINNLLVADTLTRLTNLLPPWVGEMVFALLLGGSAIAAVIVLICRRKDITAYRRENPMHPWCVKSFFAAPGVIVMTIVMALNMLLTIKSVMIG